MKIVFDKSTLMSALIPAAGLVPGHNTAAAIDGILFECPGEEPGTCRICAYDMEKGIRTSIPTKYMDEGKFIEEATPAEFFTNPKSDRAKDFLSKVL